MNRTIKTILLAIFVITFLATLFRETGIISFDNYRCHMKGTVSSDKETILRQDSSIDYDSFTINISPSINDYTPFFKSRTFDGNYEFEAGDPSFPPKDSSSPPSYCKVNVRYHIYIQVTGLCSARRFRQLAVEAIIEHLKKDKIK